MTQQGADKKPLSSSIVLWCTFVGGDGEVTGQQLRYPCKLRRHICARCGMHRGDHSAGIRDEDGLLPPRKRSAFRMLLGEFQLLDLGGGKLKDGEKREEVLEEGQIWSGDAVPKGRRGPRRRRAGKDGWGER
ncbi:hypothetical protein BS78_04G291300 [Paspalum vaginatum]|nr:hypothetical protein BS78_04G291300 [Paspalum vaginatum]